MLKTEAEIVVAPPDLEPERVGLSAHRINFRDVRSPVDT